MKLQNRVREFRENNWLIAADNQLN
ncbi:Protein of unknown function [Bacillus cytotoxicus]|uniref:Uncharacterized protein n=1 Tax=Bacillus cytotoxicus TaxID=580165 RepID=A0AAX2CMQ5_9BACI|nr:Protein of unknown function [Bacillus cytotoxicus]SCN42522.1 Protein of unknown function [Bacillus cytotoxicus]